MPHTASSAPHLKTPSLQAQSLRPVAKAKKLRRDKRARERQESPSSAPDASIRRARSLLPTVMQLCGRLSSVRHTACQVSRCCAPHTRRRTGLAKLQAALERRPSLIQRSAAHVLQPRPSASGACSEVAERVTEGWGRRVLPAAQRRGRRQRQGQQAQEDQAVQGEALGERGCHGKGRE
eukprot:2714902-Rhodomonas_salina.1